MARIVPDGWRALAATGAAERERQTLEALAAGLDDAYTVYHGVHWTRVNAGNHTLVGEVDFAIVGPGGGVLLIEQKSGFLTETPDGLVKQYADRDKHVPSQMARAAEAMRARLRTACRDADARVDALLYCPDYTVRQPGTAGIDPARIVDASRREHLMTIIRGIVPPAAQAPPGLDALHRFFGDLLELVPELDAVVGAAGTLYTRLSGGLAHWARRIEAEPFRLRVAGTAGSGKTQLALAVYRDAVLAGRRPLYVCYNRPLADHIRALAPPGGEVATYHQLGDRIARAAGQAPDFAQPGAFARLEAALDAHTPAAADACDELIVDEGQDFQDAWAANLLRFLRPGGRAWWLEDPLQNLYGRAPVALPGWVTLRSDINYRSPTGILAALNRLLPQPLEAGCPVEGAPIEIIRHDGTADLITRTVRAITACVRQGYRREHIAVITYRGREHSALAPYDRLGPYRLRAPTGQYDLLGNALLTDGDVVIDSVHRYKGRAAPCVILTEIDFETLDDTALRRLFVGATRATMKLVLVASARAADVLEARLAT